MNAPVMRAISAPEKAAIVLSVLGPEAAAPLLREMQPGRIKRFARAVADLRSISAEQMDEVCIEFIQQLQEASGIGGGKEEARRFLAEFMEEERLNEVIDDLGVDDRPVWTALADVEDERLIGWLKSEHPQVAAIALAKLPSAKSAALVEKLDEDLARQIVTRMGLAANADAAVIAQIGEVIEREFLPMIKVRSSRMEPADMIAAVMNHVSGAVRDQLLSHLEGATPDLAGEVRKVMFTFEDIPTRIAARDVSLIIKAVDEAQLMTAMKSQGDKAQATAEFILGNITKRLAERMREDLKSAPDPSPKECEAAQSAVVSAVVGLRDSGELKIIVPEADE